MPAAPPRGPPLIASALAVGPDLALSILPPGACAEPQVAGRRGRISRQDAGSSLVLLEVPGLQGPGSTGPALPPLAAAPAGRHAGRGAVRDGGSRRSPARPATELFAAAGELLAPPAGAASAAIAAAAAGAGHRRRGFRPHRRARRPCRCRAADAAARCRHRSAFDLSHCRGDGSRRLSRQRGKAAASLGDGGANRRHGGRNRRRGGQIDPAGHLWALAFRRPLAPAGSIFASRACRLRPRRP